MTKATASADSPTTMYNAQPQRRLVLLGASNLARGIATVVQTARTTLDGPLDLMAALGHGRSYGRGTWVMGRWLPGIVDCQLWEDLAARDDRLPTTAVVTDVGNDILYGASVDQIISWVDSCLTRLRERECRIVLTGIPLGSLQQMGEWEFPVFRTILYPGCKLTRDQSLDRATQLAETLKQLANAHGVHFVDPDSKWYGRDRIHIARGSQAPAWQAFMSALAESEMKNNDGGRGTWAEFFAIRSLTPYRRKVLGFSQHCEQPSGRLRDGTLVSLY